MSQVHVMHIPDDGGPVPLVRIAGLPDDVLRAVLAAAAAALTPPPEPPAAPEPEPEPTPVLDEPARLIRDVLTDARQELGWSIAELARKVSLSPSAVSMRESGDRDPGLAAWQEQAAALGYEIVARPIGGDPRG